MRVAYFTGPERSGPGHLGVVDTDAGVAVPFDGLPAETVAQGVPGLMRAGLDPAAMALRESAALPLGEARFRPPVPRPARNIFCVGKNYREHAAELHRGPGAMDDAGPEHPIIFTKPPTTVIGDGDSIFAHPGVTAELDYEAELAVVIGRRGRAIPPEAALGHVWGYTVVNDVTARDLQRDHQQWFLGKALDTFCPMGPWVVTADGFDVEGAVVTSRVNGERRQQGSVRDLVFDIPTIIATISAGITLEPGDVISTGAPAGVGMGFEPPRFLRPGDVVEASVSGIGTLTNTVAGPEG